MKLTEINELKAAASVIDMDTRAGMVAKVGPDGNLIITTYGDHDALCFIYKCLTKSWLDYDDSMASVCRTTAKMGNDCQPMKG